MLAGFALMGRVSRPAARRVTFVVGLFCASLLVVSEPQSRIGVSVGLAVCLGGVIAVHHRRLFSWRTLASAIALVLLLIPIRRYQFVSGLPFNLEIYRMLLFFSGGLWAASLLVDSRVRLRRSLMDMPLAILGLIYLASIAACGNRLAQPGLTSAAIKQYSVFLGFVLLYFFLTSVIRTREDLDAILRVLVGGGGIVATASLFEARTHWNVFDHLATIFPFLQLSDKLTASDLARGGHLRALASAEHPIALSAVLVMLVPLGVYLAEKTKSRRWWVTTFLLLASALGTLSRTGILMLAVIFVVYFFLRPREARELFRRARKFILPLIVALHFVLPGTIGTVQDLFLANGGVIAQQSQGGVGSSRLASFGPGLAVIGQHPLLGLGYGTRITDTRSPFRNSFITDDGWLSTGMEAGLLAVFAWLTIFLVFLTTLARAALRDATSNGRLLAACAASSTAFAVGMVTYDALSFLQVTFLLFIVFAVGSVALRTVETPAEHRDA